MLAEQRHREILGRLAQTGAVRVADLALGLDVTEDTIRRDLDKLDRDGSLMRTRGGAVPRDRGEFDLPFAVRQISNHEEKASIARASLDLIRQHDVVALDASSTAHELAKLIPDWTLTVITNAMHTTATLAQRDRVRVVSTGGVLDQAASSWTGAIAEAALDQFNIHTLFLSAKGVDLERGLSDVDEAQARLKRKMMDRADRVVLLADHCKFGRRSAVNFADIDRIDTVITSDLTDGDTLKEIEHRGVALRITSTPRSETA